MKSIFIIIIVLFIISGLSAFDWGTINPGGTIAYSSHSYGAGSDPVTIVQIAPQVGYFVGDNFALDFMLNYQSINYGHSYSEEDTGTDYSNLGLGFGGKFYYNNFYAGAGLILETYTENLSYEARFFQLSIGELAPLAKNVYLDFGLAYDIGFGNYTGDLMGRNEETQLDLVVGIQVFLPSR